MNRKKFLPLLTILIATFIFVGVSISQENRLKTITPTASDRLILGVTHGQTKRANISQIMKDGILKINEYLAWRPLFHGGLESLR